MMMVMNLNDRWWWILNRLVVFYLSCRKTFCFNFLAYSHRCRTGLSLEPSKFHWLIMDKGERERGRKKRNDLKKQSTPINYAMDNMEFSSCFLSLSLSRQLFATFSSLSFFLETIISTVFYFYASQENAEPQEFSLPLQPNRFVSI